MTRSIYAQRKNCKNFFQDPYINTKMKEFKVLSPHSSMPDQICKYLEYLDFVKNLSSHSIRAYGSDLLQVFQIKSMGKLKGPKLDKSPKYLWDPKENLIISGDYEFWKEKILVSMRSWAKISPKSRKRKLSSLSQFIEWLKSEEKVDFPFILPPSAPPTQKIPNFLSVDECLSIISHLEKDPSSPTKQQQRVLFYLLYGCGLRISEACSIKWSDISLSRRSIKILGKGNKERLAVIPTRVVELLSKTPQTGGYLFGEKPLPTRTGYERVRQLGKACGLMKPLHPHALRHSYATQLLTSGSDLRVLQQLLGHQSLSATELYTHLNIDQLALSMERYHPLSNKDS